MNDKIANIDAHIIDDIRTIITKARSKAYQSINEALIRSNWEIGKRIVEEEQLGKQRADYGIQLIKSISQQLTTEFGSGYGVRNLAYFKQLYQYFPDWEILHARAKSYLDPSEEYSKSYRCRSSPMVFNGLVRANVEHKNPRPQCCLTILLSSSANQQ